MIYKLKYSQDAKDKLKEIKANVTASWGQDTAKKVVTKITSEIRGLQENPKKGPSVETMLGIPTPYRFLHIEQNYVFYRLDEDTIRVTDIYNEREDFMWRMFRVNLRTQESLDFWGE